MDLIGILSVACILLYGMLGVFLIVGIRKRTYSNSILGIFFILWAFNFLDGWLLLDGFYLNFPQLAMWEEPFALLYGPLIYFYAKSLISNFSKQVKRPSFTSYFPHLIPFICYLAIILVVYHFKSVDFKLEILRSLYEFQPTPSMLIPVILVFAQIFIYVFLTYRLVKKYDLLFKQYYSYQIRWLGNNLRYLIMILILSLLVSIVQNFSDPLFFKLILVVLILSILLFIGRIYFYAFQDPKLFIDESKVKYLSNPLSDEDQENIKWRINKALEEDKIYLNPELNINDLAESIGKAPRSVSQVINEVFRQSFFDLINTYRVRESERIIVDNEDPKKTILEIMYESGFNSKSSFNTQFKKHNGLTPSEFKKLNN